MIWPVVLLKRPRRITSDSMDGRINPFVIKRRQQCIWSWEPRRVARIGNYYYVVQQISWMGLSSMPIAVAVVPFVLMSADLGALPWFKLSF
uniref:Uncharacterized protein n=1 Tax=Arundo donax TaxID=35708 RepID=A0A0A8Y7Z7_ARUDO